VVLPDTKVVFVFVLIRLTKFVGGLGYAICEWLGCCFPFFWIKKITDECCRLIVDKRRGEKNKKRYPRLSIFKGHSIIRYIKSKHSSTKAGISSATGNKLID